MSKGRFGQYGGQYAPETMMAALEELEKPMGISRMTRRFVRSLTTCCESMRGGLPGSTMQRK